MAGRECSLVVHCGNKPSCCLAVCHSMVCCVQSNPGGGGGATSRQDFRSPVICSRNQYAGAARIDHPGFVHIGCNPQRLAKVLRSSGISTVVKNRRTGFPDSRKKRWTRCNLCGTRYKSSRSMASSSARSASSSGNSPTGVIGKTM